MSEETLRICRTPWKGQLVLACRKCQKKLKDDGKKTKLAKLSKQLKKLARRDESAPMLHVADVSCLKLCPKGGVTVCTEQQLMRNECSIVRTTGDLRQLLGQLQNRS
jgi:predicted metal-binding protein